MTATPPPSPEKLKISQRPEKRPYAPGRKVTRKHKRVGKTQNRKKISCASCGKTWLHWKSRIKEKNFCSDACREEHPHRLQYERAQQYLARVAKNNARLNAYARTPQRKDYRRGRPERLMAANLPRLLNHPKYGEYTKTRRKRRWKREQLLKMFNMAKRADLTPVTPQTAARIRASIATGVVQYLKLADQVMHGERQWTPTQARIFATLLNKVVPDLSASFVQHEHSTRDLRELSREELERIARGDDAVPIEYADASIKSRETAPLLDHDPAPARPSDEPARPKRGRPRKAR